MGVCLCLVVCLLFASLFVPGQDRARLGPAGPGQPRPGPWKGTAGWLGPGRVRPGLCRTRLGPEARASDNRWKFTGGNASKIECYKCPNETDCNR